MLSHCQSEVMFLKCVVMEWSRNLRIVSKQARTRRVVCHTNVNVHGVSNQGFFRTVSVACLTRVLRLLGKHPQTIEDSVRRRIFGSEPQKTQVALCFPMFLREKTSPSDGALCLGLFSAEENVEHDLFLVCLVNMTVLFFQSLWSSSRKLRPATRDSTRLIEQVQAELETHNTRDKRGGMQREAVSLLQLSLFPLHALRQKLSTRSRVLHTDGIPFQVNPFIQHGAGRASRSGPAFDSAPSAQSIDKSRGDASPKCFCVVDSTKVCHGVCSALPIDRDAVVRLETSAGAVSLIGTHRDARRASEAPVASRDTDREHGKSVEETEAENGNTTGIQRRWEKSWDRRRSTLCPSAWPSSYKCKWVRQWMVAGWCRGKGSGRGGRGGREREGERR